MIAATGEIAAPLGSIARRTTRPVQRGEYLVHSTLRVTLAMEADVSDHVWDIKELIALLGAEGKAGGRAS